MGARQSQEEIGPTVPAPRNANTRPHHTHSAGQSSTNRVRELHHHHSHRHSPALQHTHPHSLSQSRHRGSPSLLSSFSQPSYTHRERAPRERERRTHTHQNQQERGGHSRPQYVGMDFTMPTLDQRLVVRPRSVTGTHDTGTRPERRHRGRTAALSSSAPVNSILFVRGLSSEF